MNGQGVIQSAILDNDAAIRAAVFVTLFVILAFSEAVYPRRKLSGSKPVRWYSNLGMSFLNILSLRFVFPLLGLGVAKFCRDQGWGFFNDFPMPYALAFVLSVVALDFIVYLHHIMFHAVPWLWRLHRVHHADVDLDVTSAVRFHFLESIVSMGIKLGAIVLLGPPVMAVLVFEILLNGAAMFNHANLRIPENVDRILRWFIVTPDMHRVHHSIIIAETNSNYGFNLTWWDRIFRTYRAQPSQGHAGMTIGLDQYRSTEDQHLHRLLIQPIRSDDVENFGPKSPGSSGSKTDAKAGTLTTRAGVEPLTS